MNFSQAQRKWEASWENGPPDDPLEDYPDYLAHLSNEELEEEWGTLVFDDEGRGYAGQKLLVDLRKMLTSERQRRMLAQETADMAGDDDDDS